MRPRAATICAGQATPDWGIHGEVYLWGTVVEHELGWRAQYACPKNFFLPLEMLPVGMRVLEPRLQTLAAYGCDIHLIGKEGNLPLWVRGSGYERRHSNYSFGGAKGGIRGGNRSAESSLVTAWQSSVRASPWLSGLTAKKSTLCCGTGAC